MAQVALTEEQRKTRQVARVRNKILTAMNSYQGARRLDNQDFAPVLGVSKTTLAKWRGTSRGGGGKDPELETASLDAVLKALYSIGYTLELAELQKGART